jgi:hypothetical protein
VPDLTLALGHTEPYVSVTATRLTWEGDTWIIIHSEHGWQVHQGGDGTLYEFATAQEVAEFVGSLIIRPRG